MVRLWAVPVFACQAVKACNFAFFSGLIDAQFWAGIAQLKSPELTAKIYLFSSGLSPRPFLAHPLTKNYPVVLSE
ncbi:hypothetical protein EHU69_03545 [Escherichia coli]|nr:hypothetical protein [Escherichia coli]